MHTHATRCDINHAFLQKEVKDKNLPTPCRRDSFCSHFFLFCWWVPYFGLHKTDKAAPKNTTTQYGNGTLATLYAWQPIRPHYHDDNTLHFFSGPLNYYLMNCSNLNAPSPPSSISKTPSFGIIFPLPYTPPPSSSSSSFLPHCTFP